MINDIREQKIPVGTYSDRENIRTKKDLKTKKKKLPVPYSDNKNGTRYRYSEKN